MALVSAGEAIVRGFKRSGDDAVLVVVAVVTGTDPGDLQGHKFRAFRQIELVLERAGAIVLDCWAPPGANWPNLVVPSRNRGRGERGAERRVEREHSDADEQGEACEHARHGGAPCFQNTAAEKRLRGHGFPTPQEMLLYPGH